MFLQYMIYYMIKLQTRLRFNFIYLNEHNFNPFIPNAPIL